MISISEAAVFVFAMGFVILLCRSFPFLFFSTHLNSSGIMKGFLKFVELTVPPVAMTVLAFNVLGGAFRENVQDGILVLAASVFTVLLHLWKRNVLVSILGGTALYMILLRVF